METPSLRRTTTPYTQDSPTRRNAFGNYNEMESESKTFRLQGWSSS